MNLDNLRILHFLSPVRWKGDTFSHENDSNYKVAKKTIDFLPNCHHYLMVPEKHNIPKQDNISFIEYNYPKSVLLNRVVFDHRKISFDLSKTDVDFVFCHQPEHLFSLKSWFDSKRYNHCVGFFSFFHWIDCRQSRCEVSPPAFFRQLDSFIFANCNFVHTHQSLKYFSSNFEGYMPTINLDNISYMPLSPSNDTDIETFDLPNKKIIVFNHRWNKSTGVDKLKKFLKKIDNKDYLFWFTDEKSDISGENIIIKSLNKKQYNFLLQNCYCSICFVDDYCTWNLSCQDTILFKKPSLVFEHPTIKSILGENYPYYFKDIYSFNKLLENLPNKFEYNLSNFDEIFKNNLLERMVFFLQKHKDRKPKYINEFINQIKEGKQYKREILDIIRPNIKLSGADAPIRRALINKGIFDDIKSPISKYSIK